MLIALQHFAIRELVLLHPVDEINLMEELGKMATVAYIKKNLNNKQLCKENFWLRSVK